MNLSSILLTVLVLLPVLGGLICWFAGKGLRALTSWIVPTIELGLVILLAVLGFAAPIRFDFHGVCGLGLGFTLDGLRWILCLMGSSLWFGSAVFGQEYLAHAEHKSRYYLYYLITEGATLGVFLAADLYTLLVCFEVMSVASWTLVAHEETPGTMKAADSYLAFAVIGGLVTLMGLFMLQDMFGTVDIARLQALAPGCENRTRLYVEPFFHVEESAHVDYFTLGNLKGGAISIGIGLGVYLLFVRPVLMRKGEYLDRWPAFLNLEDGLYRPLLLKVLPFLGALAARTVGTLPEVLRKGCCALLYQNNHNGYVHPRENERFTVYEQLPEGTRGYGASLNFSLLMFSMGLVIILVFLFLQ